MKNYLFIHAFTQLAEVTVRISVRKRLATVKDEKHVQQRKVVTTNVILHGTKCPSHHPPYNVIVFQRMFNDD